MSATNTPARSRNMLVPGIDTRGAFESHRSSPRGLPSSWPMTPPQTALELRRSSLAYSSVSDASTSGPSSSGDYSQPATPVHSLGAAHDQFSHGWNADSTIISGIAEHCSLEQASQAVYHPTIVQAMSGGEISSYSPTRHHHPAQAFGVHDRSPMHNTWTHADSVALYFDSGMKTTLYQTTQGLGQSINEPMNTSPMYVDPAYSMHHPSLEPSVFQEFNNAAMYPPAQVVVPSQVNSQDDYTVEQYPDYEASEMLDSTTTNSSGWVPVGPQSPDAVCFDQSEDDDYVTVKPEISRTPVPRQCLASISPYRVGRRTSRKSRKMTQSSQFLEERNCHGITVRIEGKEWERDSLGQLVAKCPDDSKPQRCTFVGKDGKRCNGKFTRSEHLKRHMTSHSTEKLFPCPLQGCEKEMSRPDNAGDHFKTHLKGPAKGKRNKACTFEQLADAMQADGRWEDKKMLKMLSNLEKWFRDWTRDQEDLERAKALEEDVKVCTEYMQASSRSMSYEL